MAIPRDTRQAQLQTPKVAEGRAVDASKRVAEAYQPAINLVKQASDTGGNILNFLQKEERATAMYDAQNAANEYIQERQKLDEWFETQTYDEARKSLPRYYTEAQKLHDKFVGSIDKIKVADIREGFRQKINGFNQSQSNQIEAFVYKQKKEAEDLSMKSSLNLGSQEAARVVSPTATAENNWKAISASMQPYMAQYNEYMENNNIPQEAREVYRQQWINGTLAMAVNNMSTKVDRNGIDPYKDVHQFAVEARKVMSEDAWQETITNLEKQRLDLAFDKNPEQFESNGKFNDSVAKYYAPNMNTEARRKHIKQVAAGNAANGGAGGGIVTDANDIYLDELRNKFRALGYEGLFLKYMNLEDLDDEEIKAISNSDEQKLIRAKTSMSDVYDLLTELNYYNKGVIGYNQQTKESIVPKSEQDKEGLEKQGFVFYNLNGQLTPSEQRKMKQLQRRLSGYAVDMTRENKLINMSTFWSSQPTVDDVLKGTLFAANGEANAKEGFWKKTGRFLMPFDEYLFGAPRYSIDANTLYNATQNGIGDFYNEIGNINRDIDKYNSTHEIKREHISFNVGRENFDNFIERIDALNESYGDKPEDYYSNRLFSAYSQGVSTALGENYKLLKNDSITNSAASNMADILSPEYSRAQIGKDFLQSLKQSREAYRRQQEIKMASKDTAFSYSGAGVGVSPQQTLSDIDYRKKLDTDRKKAGKMLENYINSEDFQDRLNTLSNPLSNLVQPISNNLSEEDRIDIQNYKDIQSGKTIITRRKI